ncbi:hypothetical protein BG006_002481 [Podila minutissima]|uniref:Uncharacterized protein n=1 Tax=Podila minutissima TaxID=64525 RepID=A0A9P5SCQ1_9FUNG|nr:hypothetical protein BG006_002481 [Podila minutissima]
MSKASTMHVSITSITLLKASALSIISAQDKQVMFSICTCFNPKFDALCCMYAKGFMMNDGNVHDTPDTKDSINKFESCCTCSGGQYKCKYSYHDPKNWPPMDMYSCKA